VAATLHRPSDGAVFLRRVRAGLRRGNPALRHAVRLGVALPVGEVLSQLVPWQRAYWLPVTVVVVLRPDYSATMVRGAARVLGTAVGVVLAGVIMATVHPSGWWLVALVLLTGWATFALFGASFAAFSMCLTAVVALLIATADPAPLPAVADRALDTLVGGSLALLAYAVWPTWEGMRLRDVSAALLDAVTEYARVVLGGYVEPRKLDPTRLSATAAAARKARSAAIASVERAAVEPARAGGDTLAATTLLTCSRQIMVVLHALRVHLADPDTGTDPVPELAPVASAFPQAVALLAEAVREGRPPADMPDLRECQRSLAARAGRDANAPGSRRLALLAAHLDPVADSVDVMAHVLLPESGGRPVTPVSSGEQMSPAG
jgi:uncharacterized membrane protein YccC